MDSNEIYIKAEDIELLKDLINRKNKGLSVTASTVVELYNRIMGKPAKPTSCRACLIGYISTMERKWANIERAIEKAKQAEVKEEAPVEETPKEEDKPKTKGVAKKTKK